MQVKTAKKEQFFRLPASWALWILPLLRTLELQVFLAALTVGQDRWGTTPIVVSALAGRLKRDPAQVRRSLRRLSAYGLLQVEAGPRLGSYMLTPAAPDQLEAVKKTILSTRVRRKKGQPRAGGEAPELRLVPPPLPQPPRKPRRGKAGKGGGGDERPPVSGVPLSGMGGGSPSVPPAPPSVPQESPPKAPPVPPPAAPLEHPEPSPVWGPPADLVLDWTEVANCSQDSGCFLPVQRGTFSHVQPGLPGTPSSISGEISKNSAPLRSAPQNVPDSPRACTREAEPAEAERSGGGAEAEFFEFVRESGAEAEGAPDLQPGRPVPLDEIFPGDPDDPALGPDPGDETGPGRVQLVHLEHLEILIQPYLPTLPTRVSRPLLAQLLGWASDYPEAAEYVTTRLAEVTGRPEIKAPLKYVIHEPSFRAWQRGQDVDPPASPRAAPPASSRGGGAPATRPAPSAPHHGPAPLSSQEWAPIARELEARLRTEPPPAPARRITAIGDQARINKGGASAALASLSGPPAHATLEPDFFAGVGQQTYRGYRYVRAVEGEVWRRKGRAT